MLDGSALLWNLDRSRWEKYKNTFVESYKNLGPWLQKIGYDELFSHRFVRLDHQVQESIFSPGNSIIVNFWDKDYILNGKMIKAKSYSTINYNSVEK